MKDGRKAFHLALWAVLLWSTVATAFKLSLRYLTPAQLLLYASLTSLLFLSVVLLFRGDLLLAFRCTPRQYGRSLVLGLLNPFLYYLILFKAYDLLPAQEAQALNYTWAITLSLLSVPLLGQRLRGRDLLALLLGYAGVLVIATRGDLLGLRFSSLQGVALALGSTVLWSLFWIGNARDARDPIRSLFLNFALATPCIAAFCWSCSPRVVPTVPGLAGALYVGLFEMGFTFVLWLSAMRLTRNTARIANLIFLSPFLSLVFIRLVVGEEIFPSTLVGLVLIVGGLALQSRPGRVARVTP